MELTMADAAVYVYTAAVLVTGLILAAGGRPEMTPLTLALVAVLAGFWTLYFSLVMKSRFVVEDEDDEEAAPSERVSGNGPSN
ncbi:MAG: hypothetical protein ABEJ40_10185 [Haloarculaceae archaeon]